MPPLLPSFASDDGCLRNVPGQPVISPEVKQDLESDSREAGRSRAEAGQQAESVSIVGHMILDISQVLLTCFTRFLSKQADGSLKEAKAKRFGRRL